MVDRFSSHGLVFQEPGQAPVLPQGGGGGRGPVATARRRPHQPGSARMMMETTQRVDLKRERESVLSFD